MRPHASSPRLLGCGLLLAALVATVAALLPTDPPAGSGPTGGSVADRTRPIAVLRAWDRARAEAWSDGDVTALGRLYVPGSRSGRADRALLRAYADRGLRVGGMRMQVAEVEVLAQTRHRLELLVTDRLAGAVAHGGERRLALPGDAWSRRRIVMVRSTQGWRVEEVDDRAQARPAASTADTSGSSNS